MADPNNAPNSDKAISFSFGPSNEEPRHPRPADPDRPCPHEDFNVFAAVNRITRSDEDPTVIAYTADLRVSCVNCGEPFRWTGVQAGMSPKQPMVSPDEFELRAPLRPASADPDFGLGIPGFAVTWKPGRDGGA